MFRVRKLTPRECMRLQGVPDDVTDKLIEAGISDTQMYRAAGDAVTVNVIYEVAKKIGEVIDDDASQVLLRLRSLQTFVDDRATTEKDLDFRDAITETIKVVSDMSLPCWKLFDEVENAYQCSICGEIYRINNGRTPSEERFNYCPNCGMKMEKADE